MFTLKSLFFGERSVTKVAGLFGSCAGAEEAARTLLDGSTLTASQITVLGPPNGETERRAILNHAIAPEARGLRRTSIRAHVMMGGLGMLTGGVLFVFLAGSGGAPGMLADPGIGVGALLGLMAGAALAIRLDQGYVIEVVGRTLEHGGWAVVARPKDPEQTHQVVASLRSGSERIVRSL